MYSPNTEQTQNDLVKYRLPSGAQVGAEKSNEEIALSSQLQCASCMAKFVADPKWLHQCPQQGMNAPMTWEVGWGCGGAVSASVVQIFVSILLLESIFLSGVCVSVAILVWSQRS